MFLENILVFISNINYREMLEYHKKLTSAKVKSKLIKYSGVMHGFYSQIGILDKSQKAMDASCEYLQSVMF